MNPIEGRKLIDKYLKGECSPEEKALLERFYQTEASGRKPPVGDFDVEKTRAEIWKAIEKQTLQVKGSSRYNLRPMLAAASILLVFGVSIWFYTSSDKKIVQSDRLKDDKQVGRSTEQKVMLTLADGTTVPLDQTGNTSLPRQAGSEVITKRDGSIEYRINGSVSSRDSEPAYNTLTIPRGASFHLTLSDGTHVWLNSASSITYPAAFTGTERSVKITGEAYFEVARSKEKPFLVRSGDQTVRVLGTHFNVLAYAGEPAIVTTLLEGSIKVLKNDSQVILEPGQAASNHVNSGSIKVTTVNAQEAIAWKRGYFIFNNESLESIMKKIARWYDIDVEFRDDIKSKRFWGTYSQDKTLDDLLKTLEQTGDVHFKKDGRRITVMK